MFYNIFWINFLTISARKGALQNAEGVAYHRPGCDPLWNNAVLPIEPRRGDTIGLRVPPFPGLVCWWHNKTGAYAPVCFMPPRWGWLRCCGRDESRPYNIFDFNQTEKV